MTLRTRLTAAFLLVVLVPLLLAGLLLFALLPQGVDRLQGEPRRRAPGWCSPPSASAASGLETVAATVATPCGPVVGRPRPAAAARGRPRRRRPGRRRAGAGRGRPGARHRRTRPRRRRRPLRRRPAGPHRRAGAPRRDAARPAPVGRCRRPWSSRSRSTTTAVGGVSTAAEAAVVAARRRRSRSRASGTVEPRSCSRRRSPSPARRCAGTAASRSWCARCAAPARSASSSPRTAGSTSPGCSGCSRSVVVGSGVLAVVIATGLARATTSPLEELGRGASRVADGDLTTGDRRALARRGRRSSRPPSTA